MGTVFLARVDDVAPGLRIGDRVALKVVHPQLVQDFEAFTRFVQEAELGKRIRHENVVGTLDAGMDVGDSGETVYLAMEFVAGRTLGEILASRGPLTDGRCRRIGREVARGLTGIHAVGAVHGDLKPANVLMTPDEVVKVMDLGLAHLHGRALETSERRRFQGTILYAAPEQFGSAEGVDARTDLYALGLVLYELASGTHPFAHDDPRLVIRDHCETDPPPLTEVTDGASPFLSAVVAQLLSKQRDRRFRSAGDLFLTLQQGEESRWWRRRATPGSLSSRVRGLERLDVHRGTLLRGRDAALCTLRDALAEAHRGEGRVVLVSGPPGIGRSRLVDAFVRLLALEEDPALVRIGVHHRGSPWADAYRRPLELPGACTVDTVCAAALDGAAGAAVLVVDDLHACHPPGRDFFLELAAAAAGRPLLVVGTARDDVDRTFRAEVAGLEHAREVVLGALDATAVEGILVDLHGRTPSELEVRCLLDRTGGHPGHVLGIARGADQETIEEAARNLTLPRLRALADDDRDLVDAAASVGSPFTVEQLVEMAGLPKGEVARRLTYLERAERVLVRDGDAWRFPFPATEQAVRDAIPEALRTEYRRMAAEVLERTSDDHPRVAAAWFAAGEPDRAAAHLDAGLTALRPLPHRVLALAERAFGHADAMAPDLLDRVRLHRAIALLATGRHADVADELRMVVDGPAGNGDGDR